MLPANECDNLLDANLFVAEIAIMDRLDAMRMFAQVADCGSFAGAARRSRVSPAAATRAVAQLEDELGLMLLRRTTRSVRLTERGAVYLERCRQVLADVEDAVRLARGQDAEPRGSLSVAAPVLFGRLHVLPVVEPLLKAHPAVSVRLTLSDRNVSLGEEGVDVAVRIGPLNDSAMVARKVAEVQRVLVAAPDYLATRGAPAAPSDLAKHDVLMFEGVEATGAWRFGPQSGTVVRPTPRLTVNGSEAAIAAAEAGLGITRALSYQVKQALDTGRLRLVLQAFAPPPLPVSLLHLPARLGSANVNAFMDLAARALRERVGSLVFTP
jgi:DNA-binding transcriptional LysR family regulator